MFNISLMWRVEQHTRNKLPFFVRWGLMLRNPEDRNNLLRKINKPINFFRLCVYLILRQIICFLWLFPLLNIFPSRCFSFCVAPSEIRFMFFTLGSFSGSQTQRLAMEHKKIREESTAGVPLRRGPSWDFALVDELVVAHGPSTTERGNGVGTSE